MNKKELRKTLESALTKAMETALENQDQSAGKKILKSIRSVSKELARKFFKAGNKKSKTNGIHSARTPVSPAKAAVKKAVKKVIRKKSAAKSRNKAS